MSSAIKELQSSNSVDSGASYYTQKLKDGLFELKGDFLKAQKRHKERLQRETLFKEAREEEDRDRTTQELLFKERYSLNQSNRATDELLHTASTGLGVLRRQRKNFERSGFRMQDISDNVPAINSLIKRIRDKKTRDQTVLSIVVALCICGILLYILSKF